MRRWGLLSRLLGFSAVSAGTVAVTQAVLLVAYAVLAWPALVANAVAVCVAAGPAYWANRRWVWSRTDRHSLSREILPFWTYSLAGLGVSSVLVAAVEAWWESAAAVSAANLTGFGLLWIGKFVLLERVLFARPPSPVTSDVPQR
ncbi:GtrA family protein [Candidatus Poriferisodalis sp.]|uniref:GtrA family protein n=1 Tax=Candidatus Poriferisodalis sp. TaxID=3101277 RepID=UPI003B01537E